jgi:hypothetical protein
MHNAIRALLITAALAVAPGLALAQTAPATVTLQMGARTEVVTREALAAMPRVTVSTTIHGTAHVFEGVPLAALLQRVGAPAGEALRGDALADVVLVRARDGYAVALALAEADAGVRKDAVILADRVDGAPIAEADGPYRLVVAGDLRPARSARMVESIEVISVKGR